MGRSLDPGSRFLRGRGAVAGAAGLALVAGACGAGGSAERTIVKRCRADGEAQVVCECFGAASVRILKPPLIDIIVMGASGKAAEADAAIAALSPLQATEFHNAVERIEQDCRPPLAAPEGPAPQT